MKRPVEVSQKMVVQEIITDEETKYSINTLPPRETEIDNDDQQFTSSSTTQTQLVNFQDCEDPNNPSKYIQYAIYEGNELRPEFQDLGNEANVIEVYALNLIKALIMANNLNIPFDGTETYTIHELVDDDGNIISNEVAPGDEEQYKEVPTDYIMFARVKGLIDKYGRLLSEEERSQKRRRDVRYTGPKTLPMIPISTIQNNEGRNITFTLGLTYAEQRNHARTSPNSTQDATTLNTFYFGLALYKFNGSVEDFYNAHRPYFSEDELDDETLQDAPLLPGVVGLVTQTQYDAKAAAGLQSHLMNFIKKAKDKKLQKTQHSNSETQNTPEPAQFSNAEHDPFDS